MRAGIHVPREMQRSMSKKVASMKHRYWIEKRYKHSSYKVTATKIIYDNNNINKLACLGVHFLKQTGEGILPLWCI
jgi:hypothetical protein